MSPRHPGPTAPRPASSGGRSRRPSRPDDEPRSADGARKAVVRGWIEAYNARDLERLLSCTSPDVTYRPLRLLEASGSFDGHEGLRRWFPILQRDSSRHTLAVSEYRAGPRDLVLAVGEVDVAGLAVTTPFCAVYRVAAGLIVVARHYFSDPSLLDRIGLAP